jgi:hypothetical protein
LIAFIFDHLFPRFVSDPAESERFVEGCGAADSDNHSSCNPEVHVYCDVICNFEPSNRSVNTASPLLRSRIVKDPFLSVEKV